MSEGGEGGRRQCQASICTSAKVVAVAKVAPAGGPKVARATRRLVAAVPAARLAALVVAPAALLLVLLAAAAAAAPASASIRPGPMPRRFSTAQPARPQRRARGRAGTAACRKGRLQRERERRRQAVSTSYRSARSLLWNALSRARATTAFSAY